MGAARLVPVAILLLAAEGVRAAEPAPPVFARKPMASRDGDKVKIEFAADRETDVAVFIENAKGEIVRHLVAGCLGKNPPEPLKANSLAQSVEWDGKDDDGRQILSPSKDKPAAGGPFKIRVGLGLKAGYAGMAFADKTGPNHISGVCGMAAGPDGRLYVMDDRSGWLYWPAKAVHVFRRDGAYEKTIKPFPSNLPIDRLKAIKAFTNSAGRINPLIYRTQAMSFYPFEDEPASQMTVADGKLFLTVVPTQSRGRWDSRGSETHLAAIDLDGGVPFPTYAGPALGYCYTLPPGTPRLATASDGKSLFITGFGKGPESSKPADPHPFVARVRLPERGPAETLFGDPKQSGADNTHLNSPHGLAIDGKGNLLVCDTGNNRVVVLKEADGSFVGSFPTEAPAWVGVHPKTGAVYVAGREALVKFSGWKEPKEVARLPLPKANSDYRYYRSFALDASAEPVVLWVGRNRDAPALLRCEDRGDQFSDVVPAGYFANPRYWRPASDPTHRMVLCNVGSGYQLLDEATGQTRKVVVSGGAATVEGINQGTTTRLDREGNVYASSAGGGIWKCDPTGKRIPFPATASDTTLKGHIPGGSTGTTAWERDWYVDRKGDIYAKVRGTQYHGLMHVDVFAPDGTRKRTALWGVTDGSYGPRVDPQGNVYMMECVKPTGQPFPDEFKPHATDRALQHWYDWIYGSIVKFPPAGGNIWMKNLSDKNKPKAEPVNLPDSLPKMKVCAYGRGDNNLMQGALWMTPGAAHCGDLGVEGATGGEHCHCTGCDFDVDDFGRAFAPDNGRQRLTVLDTNGNVIAHFGAYGNQDCCGPDSYVPDPATKLLRPRRPEDPKDLKSPFAEPELAFSFIVGLAVTDRHAYVADVANNRVLRVRLDYAAAETVSAP